MAAPDGTPEAIEERTQTLGRALLAAAEGYRPGAAERLEDWLLTHAVADARFRGRLLRYLDVLASLDYDEGGREAKRLAQEYLGGDFPALLRPLRWLLRVARDERLPAAVVGEAGFIRRFAWAKVVAVRTLRHGAELALEAAAPRVRPSR
ncbi:MAG: hypothetical protein EXR65_04485 [Dehalococcoidia bacterium]|nr:hypothetical protein [Dehalococcoidia bacterium]